MVIEWLKIKVLPELREQYVQKDAEIWTLALSSYPGFLGKEVWINPDNLSEVVLVICWASREQWKSFPATQLEQLEKQFQQALGDVYQIIDAGEYQVRKFSAKDSAKD